MASCKNDFLCTLLYPMKRTPSFEAKITSIWKIQRCIVYGNYCILTYRILNLSNDSVQQKDTIDYYNPAEYISVNRRIYIWSFRGHDPGHNQKTVRYAKLRRYSSTVFVLRKDEFAFCSVGWKAKKDIWANNNERGLKYERWHDDLVNIN